MHKIREIVCDRFGLHPSQLIMRDQHKTVSLARMMVIYFAKRGADMSFPEIGIALNRHHTTVMGIYMLVSATINGYGPPNARIQMHVEELEKILSRGDE